MESLKTDKPRILMVIPARGGSKRLPRKNVLPLRGRPLIEWTIEAAIDSGLADRIVISSDDEEILSVSAGYDVVQMRRDAALASDTASTTDVLFDVIQRLEAEGELYDVVVLLQATSPLREADDISGAIEVYLAGQGACVVSVCESDHPIEWCGHVTGDGRLEGFDAVSGIRSQDFNPSYRLNGAIYISGVESFKKHKSFYAGDVLAYIMDRENSIDVDTEIDLLICKVLVDKFRGG